MELQIEELKWGNAFSLADCCRASAWGFNCGPAAICAALRLTPDQLRPHLGDFEAKRYTNPTLMLDTLRRLGVRHRVVYRGDRPKVSIPPLTNGLVRIQWAGPWTAPGVPVRVRYRKTHWIAVRPAGVLDAVEVFDINALALGDGGWLPKDMWARNLVPWILEQCVPEASGEWWPTHAIEVQETLCPVSP